MGHPGVGLNLNDAVKLADHRTKNYDSILRTTGIAAV